MKVLVVEDNDKKYAKIESVLVGQSALRECRVQRACCLREYTKEVYEKRWDVIVVDLMLPQWSGGQAIDASDDILDTFNSSTKNKGTACVAISAFGELAEGRRKLFSDNGVSIISYSSDDGWKHALSSFLVRLSIQEKCDFVIVTALEKERIGYEQAGGRLGDRRNIRGLDCVTYEIGSYRGLIVQPPRMGVVDAGITSALVLERLSPDLIAMSGICAGLSDDAPIGTLLIPDLCWEHQAGKWTSNSFKPEHYDIELGAFLKTELRQIISVDPFQKDIKMDLTEEDEITSARVMMAPVTSGSSVVTSTEMTDRIIDGHRKVAGLDMEIYALFRSVQLSTRDPIVFAAKTVVDLANSAKGDKYHAYGCALSARFVVKCIPHLLDQRRSSDD